MQRDFRAYLPDIYRAGDEIVFNTLGFNLDMFESVGLVQAGVERKFEIVGEPLTRCKRHFPEQVEQLGEIQPIIDFRNEIAHRYDTIVSEIVWDIVQNDLPPFLMRVKALLDTLPREASGS